MPSTKTPRTGVLRLTSALQTAFARAKAAAAAAPTPQDQLCACPVCHGELLVVRVTGMDNRRYTGAWPLEPDGFAWGADRNGDGSTEDEIVECANVAVCGVRRPFTAFMLD